MLSKCFLGQNLQLQGIKAIVLKLLQSIGSVYIYLFIHHTKHLSTSPSICLSAGGWENRQQKIKIKFAAKFTDEEAIKIFLEDLRFLKDTVRSGSLFIRGEQVRGPEFRGSWSHK